MQIYRFTNVNTSIAIGITNRNIRISILIKIYHTHFLAIQVIKASMDKVRVVVSNYHNKNASYVNGQLLNEGDQLILSEGSIIKMGNTTVVYHQK